MGANAKTTVAIRAAGRPGLPRRARLCAIAGIVLLAGCGGDSSPEPTVTPAPLASATTAVTLTGPLQAGQLVWTSSVEPGSNAPLAPVSEFPTDAPALIAALPVTNLAPGTALTATWNYNDTSMDNLTTTVVASSAALSTWIAFSLAAPPGSAWPSGTYAVAITLNGQPLQASSVVVH